MFISWAAGVSLGTLWGSFVQYSSSLLCGRPVAPQVHICGRWLCHCDFVYRALLDPPGRFRRFAWHARGTSFKVSVLWGVGRPLGTTPSFAIGVFPSGEKLRTRKKVKDSKKTLRTQKKSLRTRKKSPRTQKKSIRTIKKPLRTIKKS